MAIKRIDSYLDIPTLKGEHEKFSEFLIDDYNSIVKLFNAINNAKGSDTMAKAVKGAKELDSAIKDNIKTSSDLEKQKRKLIDLQSEEARKMAEVKLQTQQQSAANKESAKEALGLLTAYDKLNNQFKEASKNAKALAAQAIIDPKFKAEADAAAKKANELNDQLKAIDASVGQYNRHVGNYQGAAKTIVDALEKEKQKLLELEKTRISVQNAGASFNPGGGGSQNNRTVITGFAGGAGTDAGISNIGQQAQATTMTVEELDKQIEHTRITIAGFARAAEETDLSKLSGDGTVSAEVEQINHALKILEDTGLGASDAAEQLKTKLAGLTAQMYQAETAAEALSLIETELANINKQLSTTDKGSQAFKVLTKQADLLKSVSSGLKGTFTNTRTELKTLEEAAKKVGVEFGIDSKQFKAFSDLLGSRKNDIKSLQEAINFKSSSTQGLDATLQGVQAITSAYGAYEAVTALAGGGNEELQKSMMKLQAVTALVASVQGIANALQGESALVQGALAAKATFLAAAQQLAAIATGQTTTALVAEGVAAAEVTVAMGGVAAAETAAAVGGAEIAVASTAAATAMEAEAAGAVALEGGLGGVAVAEGAVAAGASTMATAIAATGIGLLVIAIAVGVYKLVTAVNEWVSVNEDSVKSNKDLADSLNNLIDAQKEYDNILRLSAQSRITQQENENALIKASGVTALQSLALDKAVAKEKLKNSTQELQLNQAKVDDLAELAVKNLRASNAVIEAEKKMLFVKQDAAAKGETVNSSVLEHYQLQIDAAKANATATQNEYSRILTIRDNYNADVQQMAIVEAQEAKQTEDEKRKFILESAKIEADTAIKKNERILNNEYSTQEQRIAAMKSNLQERLKVIQAENTAIQNDPTASGTDKKIAAKKAAADELAANKDSKKEIFDLNESYRLRDLAAQTEVNKLVLSAIADQNRKLAENDILSFKQRIDAENDYIKARIDLNDADYKKQLADAGVSEQEIANLLADPTYKVKASKKTQAELEAITAQHYANQQQIVIDGEQSVTAIMMSEFDKQVQNFEKGFDEIDRQYQKNFLAASESYRDEVTALNNALREKKIGITEYETQREAITKKYAKRNTEIELEELQKQVDALSFVPEELIKAEEELVDAKAVLAEAVTDKELEEAAKQVAIAKKKYDQLVKLDEEYTGIKKKLAETSTEDSDEDAAEDIKREKYKNDQLMELKQELFNFASELANGFFESENERLDAEQKRNDDFYAKEVENINNSTLSEKDRDAELKKLAKEKETRDIEMERRKKDIRIKQAKFEKAEAILEIGINTAIAIAKAVAEFPITGGMPFAAIAGAIGAVQIAAVLAKPIPQYAEGVGIPGKGIHPGGLAVIGEGKHIEQVSIPGHKPFYADHAMLLDLPANTMVKPIKGDELDEIMHRNLLSNMASSLMYMRYEHRERNEVVDALNEQTRTLAKAFRQKPSARNRTDTRDINWLHYLRQNIYN